MFFVKKNDEGEHCQQQKALTSSPMPIAQFHEKSFFKSTKNNVKSHVFEQASVGVTNSNSQKILETCCLKNRKRQLHSRKVANDKMSPQKPNPTHRAKLLKPKKNNTFLHFWKHENYYNRAQIKTFPKPRPSRLCNRTLQKLEVALFRKHEISTMNSIPKTLIWTLATTRRIICLFTPLLPELGSVTLGFNPHTAPGAEDVVRRLRA